MAAKGRALVIGWLGGAGRSLMGLLDRHPRGRALLADHEGLVLVDADVPRDPIIPAGSTVLEPTKVAAPSDLADLIERHGISTVVELGYVGTMDCVDVAARGGADYLCTSLENWPDPTEDRGADHNRTLIDAERLLPGRRPDTVAGSHLIGAGMNPGLVNALVPAALARFASRVGVCADGLDLAGIYITEQDTTTSPQTDPDAFGCTWMPRGCIDELYEPCTMFVRDGELVELDHPPFETSYRARCGDRLIEGLVVPHDELVTLGHRYPGVELAFLYSLPPAAASFLRRHGRGDPTSFREQRLYPPHVEDLEGRDRVGVLLVSHRHGEYWLGFDNDCREGSPLGTNATELQVAAGVLAGWKQLGRVQGIHTVEELDAAEVLDCAQAILGPLVDHHDPHARWTPLERRRA